MSPPSRRRLGLSLLIGGILTIVVAVLFVLESANGPGTGPKTFAQRRSYDQVKVEVHRTYPLALIAALAGLGLAMAGARVLGASAPREPGAQP
ncbi:MAG TPA: hypothetical protein VF530_07035 [Planctomycetota bacterium]